MRKIFTFLCAALMSAGMFATTVVTITQNDFPQSGSSFTKDGVTVSAGRIDGSDGNLMRGGSFSTTLGNFTQIEVTAADVFMLSGEGWSGNSQKKTWTGNASSVSFSGEIMGMGMETTTLKFTIEEPTVAVTGVTLNQSEAQMTVGGETLTLTATVNPNNATDQSVSWSTSDANVATVENGVVTAVAAGNATITVTTTDGSFTATCAVTVTAPEPDPAKYYIVGSMNSWKVDENYEMNPSLDAETEEYFYTLDLTTTSEFKVVKVQNGQQSWIPDGMGNNYGQNGEITEDGEYTVYFRPNFDGGEDWFYSCIYAEKTGEFVPETPTYYLVGNMTEWDVNENYELNPNIDSDIEEYFYVLDLTTTNQFKVVKVQNGQQTWYPSGMDNNYGQNGEITEDGEYTIYFRPNYDGGEDWFYNCIYVSKNEPEPAETVVTITEADYVSGNTITKDGVTLTVAEITGVGSWYITGPGTFTNTIGNFTKIEVTTVGGSVFIEGDGWTGDWDKMTWTGNAPSVSFTEDIFGKGQGFSIVCTIAAPEPEPAGEVTVVFAANDKTVERTVTLPHTFKCDWAAGMDEPDELDIIIHELYNDYYYCNNNIQASGSDQVEVGTEEDPQNDYITIKGVFEGTATVTGDYFDWITGDEGAHNYSITISIKGDEPEPTGVENVQTNRVQVTKFFRDGMLLIEKNGKIYNVQGAEIK